MKPYDLEDKYLLHMETHVVREFYWGHGSNQILQSNHFRLERPNHENVSPIHPGTFAVDQNSLQSMQPSENRNNP